MGVSEGKLRYVQVSHGHKHDKWCVILSFLLDDETYSWALDHGVEITDRQDPCYVQIAAVDPFNANLVYLQHGSAVIAMDLAKGKEIWRGYLPKEFVFQKLLHCSLLVPCVLPTWLATSHIPSAGYQGWNLALLENLMYFIDCIGYEIVYQEPFQATRLIAKGRLWQTYWFA
uniref:DUF1618 domain-containing protein n=1 Tax=Aegilops tauschii TaxID=37682 RepID=M8CHY9_AEGTA